MHRNQSKLRQTRRKLLPARQLASGGDKKTFILKPLSLLMLSLGFAGATMADTKSIIAVPDAEEQQVAKPSQGSDATIEEKDSENTLAAESENDEDGRIEKVTVVGSRLKNFEFASDLPIEVLTTETGESLGVSSTVELIKRSSLLTGSPQANNQTSVNAIGGSVVNGGNGTNTLSLRGLGAQRTLVMLDGRRLSPTGVGGAVSSPNISILPSTIINRVEILKDGASSIYGSDAIAGVVDNRLVGRTDQDIVTAFVSPTEDGGGEFSQIAGRWSKTFEKGYINVAAQIDSKKRLTLGERDYTDCRDPLISDPVTGQNLDIKGADGETTCLSFGSNNRFFLFRGGTGNFWDVNSINGRFGGLYIPDPNGTIIGPGQDELRGIIPEFARVGINNLGVTDPNNIVGPNAGSFEQVAASAALLTQTSDIILNSNAQNPEDRFSLFVSGGYDLSENTELYGQILLSRVDNKINSFRYLFDNLGGFHPSNTVGERIRNATDGALFGSLGFNIHRPYSARNETEYANVVAGARGTFANFGILSDWDWDIYAQIGRSDADRTSNFTRQDRLDATTGFTDIACDPSIINTDLLEAGQTAESLCAGVSIPWLSTRILGNSEFNAQELAFLEGTETANTVYEQVVLEGVISGDLFSLPAGDVAAAFGFHLQHDEIDDQPGANSLAGNNHNFSNSSITQGSAVVQEVFGEVGIPIVENQFLAERLSLTASGRFTKNNRVDDDGEFTYKLGLAWAPITDLKVRYSVGTSYRTPALFELFQGGTDSFGPTDPCRGLENSLRPADELANLRQNCGLFGIGDTFQATENVRVKNQGNDTGTLLPETSDSTNVGIVWQPSFADIGFAIDYFDVEIQDQIGRVGGFSIIERCLVNQSFSNLEEFSANPFCALLGPRDANNNLVEVNNGSINISEQTIRGIDYTFRYGKEFSGYNFDIKVQATKILEDFFNEDREVDDPVNDDIDRTLLALRPEYAGNIDISLRKGDFTAYWFVQYVGSSDQRNFLTLDPDSGFNDDGNIQFFGSYRFLDVVNPDTKVESYISHTVSTRYFFGDGYRLNAGINNVFDREPPQVGSFVNRIGTSANGPYDLRGRRFFLRLTKTF